MVESVPFKTASYPPVTYNRQPFPVVILNGTPWWSTAHVQSALNGRFKSAECELFTSEHVGCHSFPEDADDEETHVISTLAAYELAGRDPLRRANRMLAGWLRKRDAELRSPESPQVGPLFVVRSETPYPSAPFYSGALMDEWQRWRTMHRLTFPPVQTPNEALSPRTTRRLDPVSLPSLGRLLPLTR